VVQDILTRTQPATPAFAFGSRVLGRAKKFSDLDLVLRPDQPLSWQAMTQVRQAFEESDLPIMVDVIDWNACTPTFRALVEPQLVRIAPR
jgi:predicted nucleotidyltransferase